jgi:hypothetical protein
VSFRIPRIEDEHGSISGTEIFTRCGKDSFGSYAPKLVFDAIDSRWMITEQRELAEHVYDAFVSASSQLGVVVSACHRGCARERCGINRR